MTNPGGHGSTPYGSGPYGSHLNPESPYPEFDVFCYSDVSMLSILFDADVDVEGDGAEFSPNPLTMDLNIFSGGAYPVDDARLYINVGVPAAFTVEWIVKFNDLPTDFSDVIYNHVFLGCNDDAGPLVGFFISKIGVAYSGSVSFPGDNLQLDCTFQPIPGSSAYVSEDEYWIVRAAADINLGVVYFYMTKLSDLSTLGHQLRAILPVIPYTAAAVTPTDGGLVSVRGTYGSPTSISLNLFCAGTGLIIPNLAPVASAGLDQAARMCSIVLLDGAQSFDPEGAPVTYNWSLIDGPITSNFVIEKYDGITYPELVPTGFTDRFYSESLAVVDGLDPIDVGSTGDVLWLNATAYVLVGKGLDRVRGFYVQVGTSILPDDLTSVAFKVLRQRSLYGRAFPQPTFYPDAPGFYRFNLVVSDGNLLSEPAEVIVNVLESPLPRGCTPDLSFIFGYLSDFWDLVEGRERIAVFWSALAQVAATELFTLWQFEYAKSLRDIQRTFVRRWLHYDLLLAEPIPELTKIRAIYGGVTSCYFSPAGVAMQGLVLEITSDLLAEPLTVTIHSQDPVTADVLAAELTQSLQLVDSRFSATVLEDRVSTEVAVRIDAATPFSIVVTTTLTLFTPGSENRAPSGSTGAVVGMQSYKTNQSLEGLDIQEDDFLVLDGVAYRVSRIIDVASDPFPYQRVLVKEQLPTSSVGSWSLCGWVRSELLDFYGGLVADGDAVDFEVSEISTDKAPTVAVHEIVTTVSLGTSESDPGRMPVDIWPIAKYLGDSALQVFLARVVRRHYVPVDELVVDVPTLQRLVVIEDDEETLRRNVDYFIETFRGHKAVRFVCGALHDAGDVWEAKRPPNRLWAEYTYIDNRPLIEANFGFAVDFTVDQVDQLPDNVDYLSAVRGLWYALFNGPTIRNLRIGVQILLGLPFAEETGTIEEIRTDYSPNQGRILIRDSANIQIVRSYTFSSLLPLEINPTTNLVYVAGDTVEQFAPLVMGTEIVDYITDPTWFRGLMSQGAIHEVEKYHRFVVRVDSAAFNLTSLLFVKNFILKIKPTYTYPMFVIQKNIGDTEVSVTDERHASVKLQLHDSLCEHLIGSSWMWDQPRAAGGGWRNQYDAGPDPSVRPVWPTPSPLICWAYDKMYLCPADSVIGLLEANHGAPFTVYYDGPFAFDTPIEELHIIDVVSPGVISSDPAGTPLAVFVSANMGTVTNIRFLMLGAPGIDSTDYELLISVDGALALTVPFVDGTNTEVVSTGWAFSVGVGSVVGVAVRAATGGDRTPNWTRIRVYVTAQGLMWQFDETLPAGVYCHEKTL